MSHFLCSTLYPLSDQFHHPNCPPLSIQFTLKLETGVLFSVCRFHHPTSHSVTTISSFLLSPASASCSRETQRVYALLPPCSSICVPYTPHPAASPHSPPHLGALGLHPYLPARKGLRGVCRPIPILPSLSLFSPPTPAHPRLDKTPVDSPDRRATTAIITPAAPPFFSSSK